MNTHKLVGLQEEAHAAYHQGDFSATISVLESVIEVAVHTRVEENVAESHLISAWSQI